MRLEEGEVIIIGRYPPMLLSILTLFPIHYFTWKEEVLVLVLSIYKVGDI